MHDLALEYLHLVSQLVKLDHILSDQLLLKVQVGNVPRWSHPNPIVLLLNHVIDSLDPHQESENCVVVDQTLLVEYDLKWPIGAEIYRYVVQAIGRISVV